MARYRHTPTHLRTWCSIYHPYNSTRSNSVAYLSLSCHHYTMYIAEASLYWTFSHCLCIALTADIIIQIHDNCSNNFNKTKLCAYLIRVYCKHTHTSRVLIACRCDIWRCEYQHKMCNVIRITIINLQRTRDREIWFWPNSTKSCDIIWKAETDLLGLLS